MTRLARPDVRLQPSWAQAVAEFGDREFMHGSGLWEFDEVDTSPAGCRVIVDHLVAQADPAVRLPEGRVHCSYFWIVEDEEFVGCLALRHDLNAWLLEEGGHVGYSVRPSRRRRGHATRAVALAVREAAGLGIARALVTCDEDNVASRRTIESAGGAYEDSRAGKRRYWIDTSA